MAVCWQLFPNCTQPKRRDGFADKETLLVFVVDAGLGPERLPRAAYLFKGLACSMPVMDDVRLMMAAVSQRHLHFSPPSSAAQADAFLSSVLEQPAGATS